MVSQMLRKLYISLVAGGILASLSGFALPAGTAAADAARVGIAQAPAAPAAPAAPRQENGDMVMGAADAPVTIIEYASLTCPHCARFHAETLPKLKESYVDTGKVKYVFRDFPLDRVALTAAMVARCAGPSRYFGFLDVFFRQQAQWAAGNDPQKMVDSLKRLARLGGMSEAQFDACIQNREVQDAILAQRLGGEKEFGVSSTPTLIINGRKHAGALSFEEIEKAIKPLVGQS